MKFSPRQHFSSDRVCVCIKCERIGEGSWPTNFVMTSDGFVCIWCSFPGQYAEDGTYIEAMT